MQRAELAIFVSRHCAIVQKRHSQTFFLAWAGKRTDDLRFLRFENAQQVEGVS